MYKNFIGIIYLKQFKSNETVGSVGPHVTSLPIIFHNYNLIIIMTNDDGPLRSEKSIDPLGAVLLRIYVR